MLRTLVHDPRSRDSGNTVLSKEFPGGVLVMTGANSAVGLRSMAARYLFLDEIDGYPGDVDGEGDPINLAMARTRTFARRKVFLVSTPKITGMSRIEAAFEESDQRHYWVPCPACREYAGPQVPQLRWPKGEAGEGGLRLRALRPGDSQPPEAVDAGARPVAREPGRSGDGRTAGFHLSSLYSPVGWFSWGRRRQAVRAGAEEPVAAPGLREHGAGRYVDDAGRGSGLEAAVRPARAVQDRRGPARRRVPHGGRGRPEGPHRGGGRRVGARQGVLVRSITACSRATPRARRCGRSSPACSTRRSRRRRSGVADHPDGGGLRVRHQGGLRVGPEAGRPRAGDQGRLARGGDPRAPFAD